MRVIESFKDENIAKRFSIFLKKQKIENTIESVQADKARDYVVWVHDEDQLPKAKEILQEFMQDPSDKKYDYEIKDDVEKNIPIKKVPKYFFPKKTIITSHKITNFFILLCVGIFLINLFQETKLGKKGPIKEVFVTPVQYYLMYDVPTVFLKISQIFEKYNVDSAKKLKEKLPEIQHEISQIENESTYWKGAYYAMVRKVLFPKNKWNFSGPMFEKISQGQVWRLVTPCFLHKGIIHILFNMIWLWVLGWQIEQRLSKWKYILLIVIAAIFSNTAQYLMSGANFLGFSGVVMGMVGFIWSRQKIAPWEGYPLQKATIFFLVLFIMAMFLLQMVSFFLLFFNIQSFSPNIANTAHIAGGLVGVILGRIPFFAWRTIER
jgi:GlpG protein